MRETSKTYAMPIFPLFMIGTAMLVIALYFVAIQSLSPKPPGTRVYVNAAYGINSEVRAAEIQIDRRNLEVAIKH